MGRKRLPWIKLWVDILSDPKMARLSVAERGCWDGILLLAQQSPIRGKLMLTDTQPMTMKDIAKAQRLTSRETGVLKSCISKMTELGSIRSNNNGALEITHFIERQEKYPSDVENHRKQPRDDPGMTQGIPRDDPATAQEIKKPQKKSVLKSDVTTKSTQQNPPNAPDKLLINSENIAEKLPIDQRERKRGEEIFPLSKDKGTEKKPSKKIFPSEEGKKQVLPEVKTILDTISDRVGYQIPSYAKEGVAVKRALKMGFNADQFLSCWETMKGFEFWKGKWLPLAKVTENLGEFAAGRLSDRVRGPPSSKKLSTEAEIERSIKEGRRWRGDI